MRKELRRRAECRRRCLPAPSGPRFGGPPGTARLCGANCSTPWAVPKLPFKIVRFASKPLRRSQMHHSAAVTVVDKTDQLETLLDERILILDGAMGTQIQLLQLSESDVRGERFHDHDKDLKNFADILCLTRPDDITDIHRRYLLSGADIVETNTFGASPVGMDEFGLPSELVAEINAAAVACARQACDEVAAKCPDRPRFVAGSIGPTTRQTAISTRVDDPAFRATTFAEMADSYYVQVAALVEAGVDILMPETVIDTLNLKACLFAIERYFHESGNRVPVMVSGTFDKGGATFVSGQSIEAFWNSISHFPMLSCGHELRAGPRRHAPAPRSAAASGRRAHQLPSQRRLAERDGTVRPGTRRHGGNGRRVCRAGLGEHRRRMLRHGSRSHCGHGRSSCGTSAPHRRTTSRRYLRLSGTSADGRCGPTATS